MSTKTTFKRVALVAVTALGFGVLSVAPSQATAATGGTVTFAAAATTASSSVAVGAEASIAISQTWTSPALSIAAVVLTPTCVKPAGATCAAAGVTYATAVAGTDVTTGNQTVSSGVLSATSSTAATPAAITNTAKFTPDKAGIYVLTFAQTGATTTPSVTWTVYAGYSADAVNANKAFPTQGSNVTTGWTATAGGQATVRITGFASDKVYYVTTNSGAIISGTEGDAGGVIGTVTNTNGTNLAGGFNFTTGTMAAAEAANYMDVKVTDLGAASTTVTVNTFSSTTGASTAFTAATVTWGAAPVLSVVNSTSIIDSSTSTTFSAPAADLVVAADGTVPNIRKATIKVVLKDSALNVLGTTALTAVVTGAGLVEGLAGNGSSATVVAAGTAVGSRVGTVTTDALGQGFFGVFSDGSGGVGTITISQGTTVIATETITFSGIATHLKNNHVDADGDSLDKVLIGVAETGILTVGSYDGLGNVVSASPTGLVVTSDSTTVATASISAGTGNITVTGVAVGKTNITISVGALATATIKLVIPVTITKTTAKIVTMSFDKTSYAPGELMTLTVKGVDSNGSGVADGARVLFSDTATANVALETLPTGTVTLANGIATYTYYAPFAAGDITVTAYEGAALDAVIASTTAAPYTAKKITATTSVVNAGQDAALDAANEATDAANAATDAALAAADAADSATAAAEDASAAVAKLAKSVATALTNLKKQITALTALVNKLLKK